MNDFSKAKILVIGDLMIDRYVYGTSNSMSYEAPIPLVQVEKTELKLGAAGVVLENAVSLGATVYAIGVGGNDEHKTWLKNYLKKLGISFSYVLFDKTVRTPVRTRVIANNHHIARFDEHPILLNKQITNRIIGNLKKIIPKVNLIVICDYHKGTMVDEVIKSIKELSHKHKKNVVVSSAINDLKYTDPSFIYRITAKNAQKLLNISLEDNYDTLEICQKLENVLKCKKIILTRGEDGLSAYENGDCADIMPTHHQARDIASAGDILTAAFAVTYSSGLSFVESCTIANIAAGMAVEKIGAKRLDADELQKELDEYQDLAFQK
jgi:D-beta-D-heptose 7-phosphate kinase/D-beta-D-heptose 1-phosphate adenosyltransferase